MPQDHEGKKNPDLVMLEAVHANSRTMLEETGAVEPLVSAWCRQHRRTKREMMRTMKMKMERRRRRTQFTSVHVVDAIFCLYAMSIVKSWVNYSESLFLVLKSFVNCLWPGVCIKPGDLSTCVCMMMDAHLLLTDFVSPDNTATGQEGRRW